MAKADGAADALGECCRFRGRNRNALGALNSWLLGWIAEWVWRFFSPLTGLFLLVLNALLFLLYSVTVGTPVLLATFATAFALGTLMSILRVRHVVFYAAGGMAVACIGFGLVAAMPIADPNPFLMIMPWELAGVVRLGVAGAIDGILYWWLAGRLMRNSAGLTLPTSRA